MPLRTRPEWGWAVVGAAFLILSVSAGFGFYSLSTFAHFLVSHYNLSLTAASAGSTAYMLCSEFGGMAVVRLAGRFDMRLITVVGALIAPLVAAWVAGLGLARAGWLMSAITLAVVLPLVLLVVVAPPVHLDHLGLGSTAAELDADGSTSVPAVVVPSQPVAPDRYRPPRVVFATITTAFGLLLLSQVAAVTHMLTLGSERHIGSAATALSVLAVTSVVGRLIGIPVLTRIGVFRFSIINAFLQAVAMVLIAFALSATTLFLGSMLLGATVGNTVVLLPLMILEAFGLDRYTRYYAHANLLTSFAIAIAPLLLATIHDRLGGYTVGLTALGLGSASGGLLLATLRSARAAPDAPIEPAPSAAAMNRLDDPAGARAPH